MIGESVMALQTTCPPRDDLRQLLGTDLGVKAQVELVNHLDSCVCCQHALEEIAAEGDSSWQRNCRHVAVDRPSGTSAYWPALQAVQEELVLQNDPPVTIASSIVIQSENHAPAEDDIEHIPLDFLEPADEAGYRGKLGNFNVVGAIGRGGMGVVLKAFDPCLQRFVALKVLAPDLANDEIARQRFCREARAAAAITHEHVISIHQVEHEEARNLPYLVMQLITGSSLEGRLRRGHPLTLKEIVRIGAQTAAGLAAAHAQGLIHRDVKPANILLEEVTGNVKLTDFGLARAVEDVKLTQTGFVAGTPLYMAPEQAQGEPLDQRSDLFSFGSVLYEMCTGKPPFEGNTPFVVLRRVTEDPPRPIRELNPDIPDCLVGLIGKLQSKKPEDRFQSAAEVAELLGSYLSMMQHSTHTQTACADSTPVVKSVPAPRRQPLGALGMFGLGALVALLGALAMFRYGGNGGQKEAGPPPRAIFKGNAGPVWSVAFSPDGNTLAMAIDDGSVKLWDVASGDVKATLRGHKGPVWTTAFSPDGKSVATGSSDLTVRVWNADTGAERYSLGHPGSVRSLAFSQDGTRLVSGCRNGTVKVWDLAAKEPILDTLAHAGEVVSVAFSPEGNSVASSSGDRTIKLWDLNAGRERLTLQGHEGGIYSVAFSRDGKTLASGGWDQTARLWNIANGESKLVLRGHAQDVWAVSLSPDAHQLATGSEDHSVKIWDLSAGREVMSFRGHTGTVYTVTFSPDGKTVASAGRDGTARLWDVPGAGAR